MSLSTKTPAIALSGVSKRFGDVVAVSDVDFGIKPGEVVGFLGPNGAGKTTTMRIITGFLAADAGSVLIDGMDMAAEETACKELIGYLPENNPVYPEMTISESLELACALRGISGSTRDESISSTVELTGISGVYHRAVGELSKGFRQRVGLAQALVHKPEILILDEPTEGLDPMQRVDIRNLIKRLSAEATVLLSTHVLSEVQGTCDRAIIISEGRIIADGSLDAISRQAEAGRRIAVQIKGRDVVHRLSALDGVTDAVRESQRNGITTASVIPEGRLDVRPAIFQLAKERDWVLLEMHQEEASFEDVFRKLTAGE